MRLREPLPLRLGGLDVLAQELLGPALPAAFRVDVVAVVDVHRQRDRVLPRKLDARASISEACSMVSAPARMASRIERAPWACAATLSPCRCATSTTAAISSGVISGLAGHAAVGEHRARGDHLQEVGAACDRELGLARETRPGLARRPSGPAPGSPTRDARESRGRRHRPGSSGRTRRPARAARRPGRVDRVAQAAVRPADVGSDVAGRRESGQQRRPRVLPRDRPAAPRACGGNTRSGPPCRRAGRSGGCACRSGPAGRCTRRGRARGMSAGTGMARTDGR